MVGEELQWLQLTYHQLIRLNLVHTVQLKPMIKTHFSGRMVSSGIIDVAFASVHYEKSLLMNLIMIIIVIIMNKSQDGMVFNGSQK